MKSVISTAVAGVVLGTTVLGSVAPAAAQRGHHRDRERYVQSYCDRHSRDRDCRDFRSHRGSWNESRYQRWYRDHHRGGGDNAAAALFGLAAGAIVGGAIGASQGNSHVQACEARYRSYDRASDTYLGFDGLRHRCTAY